MDMTPQQEERFLDYQDTFSELTIVDIEESTKPLIKDWEAEWWNYIWNGAPGSDRPPDKPAHP